jgi:hypothetical protein
MDLLPEIGNGAKKNHNVRCIEWATASQESAQICANVRCAQALVDTDSDDVCIKLPMDSEKVRNVKNNVQRKYIQDIHVPNNREIFLGP